VTGPAATANKKTSGRKRAPRGQGDKLRLEIMDATEALLVRTGNSDLVSIRGIADAVGVTPPSIYRHFTDKDELVSAICERRFADFNAAVGSEDTPSDPLERLKEMGRSYGRFALDNPEHYRILMMTTSTGDRAADSTEGQKAFGRLVQAVEACQSVGRIRKGAPAEIAIALWSGVHGLVSLLITSPNFPWPASPVTLLEGIIDSQLHGLLVD
jgi:AcrR family transcriptional regulator